MLALSSIVALSVVAFFAYAGFMESFTRGMLVAGGTYKSNRPTRHHQPTSTTLEPFDETPEIELTTAINMNDTINNINADGYNMNISSTVMPTLNGSLQQVDLCHVENVIVPLSAHVDGQPPKELTFKSLEFPFKRSNPLICSWNVKVSDNCRRGLVTMKINERSRLSGDKGCTKGYYRVSPFMKETKICGRINNVPSFQWYVEDHQPENVTITLKHSGLNDGYSEGLGFTLSGECVPDESNLTISKAIKSYNNWMDQLISKRATDGLTVVLPGDALMPFDPVRLWENRTNVTKGPIEFLNVTISDDNSHPLTTQQSNSNQTDISHDETTTTSSHNISLSTLNETDPIHLPITLNVVTQSPPPPTTTTTTTTTTEQSIETTTTVRPSLIDNNDPVIPRPHHYSSPLTNNFPMIRRRPLPSTTTKKPIIKDTTSRRPTLTIFPARKRPVAQVSDNPDEEIPWLILKSPPASDPSLSYRIPTTAAVTPRPFHHQEEVHRPVIRRPLVRLPSTTVRPFDSPSTPDIPWVILKSPQRNKESSSSSTTLTHYPPEKKPSNVPTTKVPIVDDDGIPWLILKSPDPSSAEIHYPNIPSNELNKRRRSQSFSGYYL